MDDDDGIADQVESDFDFEFEAASYGDSDNDAINSNQLEDDYYRAKTLKDNNVQGAIAAFQRIADNDSAQESEWAFRALKQVVKLSFAQTKDYALSLKSYEAMLPYTKAVVTRNHGEKSINRILDLVSAAGTDTKNEEILQIVDKFFETTKSALQHLQNERLQQKTDLVLAKRYFDRKQWNSLGKLLDELLHSLQNPLRERNMGDDGVVDQVQGSLMLEVLALKIQMHTELGDNQAIQKTIQQTKRIRAIPHPRITGVIKECSGKMDLARQDFHKAFEQFRESFRAYDEAGSPARIHCLCYLILAWEQSGAAIDPFDSQELQPYKTVNEVVVLREIIEAGKGGEVAQMRSLIERNMDWLKQDQFFFEQLDGTLRLLRCNMVFRFLNAYQNIHVDHLALLVELSVVETENFVNELISSGAIKGKFNQLTRHIALERYSDSIDLNRHRLFHDWARTAKAGMPISSIHSTSGNIFASGINMTF